LTLIAGLEGNALVLWSRFFSYFIDAFLLFFSFMIAQINQRRSKVLFEFGLEKLESFSGVLLSVMVFFYACIILFAVFSRIINPTPLTENHFGFYLYILFMIKDTLLYKRLYQYTKTQRSPLLSSQKRYYLLSLLSNSIVLLPLFLANHMEKDSLVPMSIDILAALGLCFLTAYLSYGVGKRAAFDLVDRALDETIQLQILKFLSKHYDLYEQFHGQLTRQSGNIKYIELFFEFDTKKSFRHVMQDIETMQTDIQNAIPDSRVFIIPTTKNVNTR
jgi:divalent metal cation (Fe/Co/Zn/Cd) transporter